jgi:hypothetical protein
VEDSLAKALPVAIDFMANLAGLGGIVAKIKGVPIDKAVEKVVGFVADKAWAFIAKLTGAEQQSEEPPQNAEEHDTQVSAGLAALDGEQKKQDQDNDGALTHEEAKDAAQRVKQTYPVFKSITPVVQSGRWVFEYVASKGKHEGFKVEKYKGIREYEITTYESFVDRSIVGDNLEGHELWQQANLKAKGLAKQRLSTEASRKNPVIALERSKHIKINSAQRSINASYQSARENIEANIRVLLDNGVPQNKANELARKAFKHAKELGEME